MPQILIINASPRRSGIIDTLCHTAAATCRDAGCNVTELTVSDMKFAPCAGCMTCRSTDRCILPHDDAHDFASLLSDADAIIIGAPCWWGAMPGTLKSLFDRSVYAIIANGSPMPRPRLKRKPFIVFATSTAPEPWCRLMWHTSGVVRSVKQIMRAGGARSLGSLQLGATRKLAGNAPDSALRKCRRLTAAIIAKCNKA